MHEFRSELEGAERIDLVLNRLVPMLKELENGRFIAELAMHAADESLKTVVSVLDRGKTVLSEEEYLTSLLLAFKNAEATFRTNFDRLSEEVEGI